MLAEEALGIIAGLIISFSSLPQIKLNLSSPEKVAGISQKRQLLLVLGNALWVVYGITYEAYAIVIMCTINAVLNLFICLQIFKSQENY